MRDLEDWVTVQKVYKQTKSKRFGIKKERAVDYVHDGMGTANLYASVGKAVRAMRMADTMNCEEALDDCAWDEDIRSDYKKRKL